ncbi:MAG: hypothetical protein V1885_02605 [Candidatus Brennerbacteria bacterium]
MIRLSLIAIFFVAVFLFSGMASFAHAQTPTVQKAFEEVKTKLDDLISAKDENLADDFALRIQAFKKVVKFSAEEAKTLKVKLLATELKGADKKTLTAWKTRVESSLADAETYYEETLDALTTTTSAFNLKDIKTLASSFKEWRETSFAPIANDVEGLLLVAGQKKALEVAEARLGKIENDVKKLERAKVKGAEKLATLFAKAETHFNDASTAYARGEALFITLITPSILPEEMDATSTVPVATSTEPTTTSTEAFPKKEPILPPTIRDEIRASLEAVRQTYQAFIEMSVEVKKILK